jgi:hypothetical protein
MALDQPGFPVLVFTAGSDQRVTDLLQASAVATRGPWSVVTAAHADEAYELHR